MTTDQWEELRAILPPLFREDRALVNGILWVFTTESQWKDLPPGYGKFNTVRNRVQKLRKDGFWDAFLHKAKEFGYAPSMSEYIDDNTNPDDDAEILRRQAGKPYL